ncbi:MAG: hypothetical protein WBZ36_15810 [Candidatus Nitrosopolaris sp.]
MIMTLVLLIMLTVALGYPHYIASAKKLIGAKQIGLPITTNCRGHVCKLIGANHISTSHTTSCDGNVCQMQVCINNKCHESTTSSQGSNSTIPRTDDDQ